jgi:SPP1 gp7 family putative phage head morphogenesis protein
VRYHIVCGPACDHAPLFKLSNSQRKRMLDRDRASVRKLRVKLRVTVRKFLKEQSKDIAAQVVAAREALNKGANDDIKRILESLDFAGWQKLLGQIGPLLENIVKDGAKQGFLQVGIERDLDRLLSLTNDFAVAYAKERGSTLITDISESTRNMIKKDIAQALESGASNDVLAAVLERGYAFSPERAEMIARTETAFADVEGNIEAYKQSGQVSGKQWITGAGCCELCDELDGKIVPLNKAFPGGRNGPPLHPNCRCDVLPVLIPKKDKTS